MKHEIKDGILVIHIEGNLLGEHANGMVMQAIKTNMEAGNKKVLFNLSQMKFINSTGLGLLLTAVGKVRNGGGELSLCALPGQMKKLLQMTKLENIFKSYEDETTAINAMKGA